MVINKTIRSIAPAKYEGYTDVACTNIVAS